MRRLGADVHGEVTTSVLDAGVARFAERAEARLVVVGASGTENAEANDRNRKRGGAHRGNCVGADALVVRMLHPFPRGSVISVHCEFSSARILVRCLRPCCDSCAS